MTPLSAASSWKADLEDLVEQALLVALEADLPVELVGDAQLLVVLAQRADVVDLLGGAELVSARHLVELGEERRHRVRRWPPPSRPGADG